MARYVDVECNAVTEVIGRRAFRNRSDIQDFLDNIPTADVVPVVRCEKCKFFKMDEDDELGECMCGSMAMSYGGALYPRRNDYCSYGERRCE